MLLLQRATKSILFLKYCSFSCSSNCWLQVRLWFLQAVLFIHQLGIKVNGFRFSTDFNNSVPIVIRVIRDSRNKRVSLMCIAR